MRRSWVLPLVALVLLIFGITGGALVTAAPTPGQAGAQLLEGVLSRGTSADGSPVASQTFYADEEIRFYVRVGWDPAHGSGGSHRVRYQWYDSENRLVASSAVTKSFDLNPSHWWANVQAPHFAAGHYRAELYLDEHLLAGGEFDVLSGTRPPEPPEDAAVKETARALLLKGDLRGFDALATAFRHSRERTASGTWKLGLAYQSANHSLYLPRDPHWVKLQQAADAWLLENPDSPTAVILDAEILRGHAWAWRGEGADSQVPAENGQHFRQLLEETRRVLDAHPDIKSQDPEWDALRITIAREQGADTRQILQMAEEALEREAYYYPLHNAVTRALLPRWGGSKEAVEQYVQWALAYSAPREGTQAYARIYYYIARSDTDGDPGSEMSEMGGALWPPMQQSLAELLQAYPSAFNRDLARAISCLCGRIQATRDLGRAVTVDINPVAPWDSSQWRHTCNEWAFEGKHVQGSLPQRARAYLSYFRGFGDAFWQRIRMAAFFAFFLIEGGLALLAKLWSAQAPGWPSSEAADRAFNPMEYPRTYAVAAAREPNFIRLAIWMFLLGGASTFLLAQADSPDPLETQIVMAGCVMVAVTGALMIFSRLSARIVLSSDGVTVRALVGGAQMQRQDILGVREYPCGKGPRLIELVSRHPGAAPLRLPPAWNEDKAFRAWFDSLPALALPEAREGSVHATQAALKARTVHD